MDSKSVNQKHIDNGFLYFQLNNEERESAVYFLLEAILKARDNDPELGKSNFFDEDVNMYLAHLLFAMSLPEYHDMADPFLSDDPNEVLGWARETEDPTLRYFIYKANADTMLIRSTIFTEKLPEPKRIIFKRRENGPNRLAVIYYDQAARCHRGIFQKKTGVGEVLEKISEQYELYQKLLFRIKDDYFKFVDCFRDQAFRHFFLKLNHYEKQCKKEIVLDQFLEFYQKWMITKNPALKKKVLEFVHELSDIDPQFHFDTSKLNCR